jgi:hypothetical protein
MFSLRVQCPGNCIWLKFKKIFVKPEIINTVQICFVNVRFFLNSFCRLTCVSINTVRQE